MGIGIGDVATLASQSLGAAIGLGTKIPKYQDNSAQLELARMRAEAAKQKEYDKRLDEEKKNWQIPYDKIHPMILKNETEPQVAQSTVRLQRMLAMDPKAINSPEFFQETERIKKAIGDGIKQTDAMKADFTSVEAHPEIAKFKDNNLAEYIRKGDYAGYRAALNNLGSDAYLPNINLMPNIDLQKEVDEVLKGSNPKETERGGKFTPIGAGQVKLDMYTEYDPTAVAYNAAMKWDAKPALQTMMSKDEFVQQSWETAQAKGNIPKPLIRTIPGYGSSQHNTIVPEKQQYTLTISSPTTSAEGPVYQDALGNEYTSGVKRVVQKDKNKNDVWLYMAEDGKTRVYPKTTEMKITSKEYYAVGTTNKLLVGTSSPIVIDGRTGKQTSSTSRDYEIKGIGLFPYVTDKKGSAIILSDESIDKVDPRKIKWDYFADAQENLGMKEGEPKYRAYLVKVDANILRAAKTAKIEFPEVVQQSVSASVAAPQSKQQQAKSNTRTATISAEDQSAIDWLNGNPNHPRAAAVRKKLQDKGIIK